MDNSSSGRHNNALDIGTSTCTISGAVIEAISIIRRQGHLQDYYKQMLPLKDRKKIILRSSNNNNLKTIKIIGNFHGTLSYEKQRKVIKKFGWSFRLAGFDALNYCLLAEGKVDAVIEANLKPYDILPLIPIIKNSGAIVTNWRNEPAEEGGNILATSNRVLHNKILKLLKPFAKK